MVGGYITPPLWSLPLKPAGPETPPSADLSPGASEETLPPPDSQGKSQATTHPGTLHFPGLLGAEGGWIPLYVGWENSSVLALTSA